MAEVSVSRSRNPSMRPSPRKSSTTLFHRKAILGFAKARSCMIFDARSSLRRCTRVTLSAKRVRKFASSSAESPPPTTAISWPRKKNPSHVAHVDTPWPNNRASDSRPSIRTCAPVDTITDVAVYSVLPT